MTVLPKQPAPAEPAPVAARAAPETALAQSRAPRRGVDWPALAAGATAFCCMLPYPAYAVGNSTAIQLGNACAAVACLPLLWMSWRGRPFHVYFVLLAPLILSSLVATVAGSSQASAAFKSTIVWALSLTAMTFVQAYAPRFALHMLVGIAIATLLHAVVGVWQVYAFGQDYFPLVELYHNPSFLSVQENADTIARWTKRPFGIFPEPSAMSASLSPWLLVWMALLTGAVKLRQGMRSRHRALFAAAAAGATLLMIVSRSGQTAVMMLAALGLAALWLLRARATPRTTGIVVLALAVVLPAVLWFAAKSVGDRLGGERLGNSSWEERASSIVAGYSLFAGGDLKTLLFGFGPGLTSFAVTQEKGLEAVWSISLCYVYDTGLLGAVALLWLGSMLVRAWQRARFSLVFAAIFVVWVVGVTLTTSYEQLLPLWLALGWFTVWPDVMEAATSSPVVRSVSEQPLVVSGPPERLAVPSSSWAAAGSTLAAATRMDAGTGVVDSSRIVRRPSCQSR